VGRGGGNNIKMRLREIRCEDISYSSSNQEVSPINYLFRSHDFIPLAVSSCSDVSIFSELFWMSNVF
jgi:hypothetical protein